MSRLDIYVDGACRNNGRDDATGGIGIYSEREQVSLPLPGRQTSNSCEHEAINEALHRAPYDRGFTIKTDSKVSVDTLNEWAQKWEDDGGRLPSGRTPANWDIIQDSMRILEERRAIRQDARIEHVPGHKGVYGNERAHDLAQQALQRTTQSCEDLDYDTRANSSYPQNQDSDDETYASGYPEGFAQTDNIYSDRPSFYLAQAVEDAALDDFEEARGSSGYAHDFGRDHRSYMDRPSFHLAHAVEDAALDDFEEARGSGYALAYMQGQTVCGDDSFLDYRDVQAYREDPDVSSDEEDAIRSDVSEHEGTGIAYEHSDREEQDVSQSSEDGNSSPADEEDASSAEDVDTPSEEEDFESDGTGSEAPDYYEDEEESDGYGNSSYGSDYGSDDSY